MKIRTLLFKYVLLGVVSFIGTSMAMAQKTDTIGTFDPGLTARHIVYSELTFHDVDEDGDYDASYYLSEDTVKGWGDYSAGLAFYADGFLVRDGGGWTSSRTFIPVPEEPIKLWQVIDVPNLSYKTYIQLVGMDYPELIYDADAAFRKTDITAINKYSAVHNPDSEPDSVSIQKVELQTNSDVTLREVTSNLGEVTLLDPQYDDEYVTYVPYGTTEVTIGAIPFGIGATFIVGDAMANPYEGGVVPLAYDGGMAYIYVTSFDGNQTMYYLNIEVEEGQANASLEDIELSTGKLTYEVNNNDTAYVAIVPYGTTEVTATGIPVYSGASVTGGGNVTLENGEGSASFTVVSADASVTQEYTLEIFTSDFQESTDMYIQHETSGYVLAENDDTYTKISEAWVDEASQLFQFVPADIAGQYFIQNKNNNYLRLAEQEGNQVWNMIFSPDKHTYLDSCLFEVDEFEPGRFRLISVARSAAGLENVFMGTNNNNIEGGVYSDKWIDNQYAVWDVKLPSELDLTYNTFLSSLTCDQATLKPDFNKTVMEYYMTVPVGAASVDLTAVAEDANTTVTGAGNVAVTEDRGDIVITVTSTANAEHFKEYVIHYVKDTELTLMHSYTFADGTVRDVVGNADGVADGGYVENGVFISGGYFDGDAFVSNENREDEGFITLPADSIDLTKYPSITIEAYVTAGYNTTWSMLTYYGGLSGDHSFWMSVQSDDDFTRAVINQGEEVKSQTNTEAVVGETYHYVATLTNDSIALFINGKGVPKAALPADYMINQISTANAWIFKGGYSADPIWIGAIYEYNIYSGEMDDATILQRSQTVPSDGGVDATLSSITIDGEALEGFHPANLVYTVAVEAGAAVPVVDAVVSDVDNATKVVNQASELPGTATVVVTNGTTEITYTIEFEVVTGIGNGGAKESAIKVYPTVSTGEFTVEMEGKASMISVYDLAGGLVKQVKTNAQIEVISLDQKGMYIVKVDSDGDTKLFKVFKQ